VQRIAVHSSRTVSHDRIRSVRRLRRFPVTSSGRPTNGPYICLYPFPLGSALRCSTTLGAHAASRPLARAARRPLHSPTGERPREAAREAVKRHSAQSASASRRLELRRTPPPCDGVSSPCRRKDFPFTHSPFASADGSSALPSASAVQRVPPWHRGQHHHHTEGSACTLSNAGWNDNTGGSIHRGWRRRAFAIIVD
jgi:hypothetical protein